MVTEEETEDLARVAYAAYALVEGCELPWEKVDQRRQKTIRRMAAAVQVAVLGQFPEVAEQPRPACVHNWAAVDYWRDLGTLTLYCTKCAAVERREVPR